MKIGIIVFSKTGNTSSVANRFKERLLQEGHSVSLEMITALNDDQMEEGKVKLQNRPDASGFDVLLLGSPVRGFAMSAVMSAYLSQSAALEGKKVFCFVTQAFPFPWMGGNRAIEQMKAKCETKGAKVCGTGIVNWSSVGREKKIENMVQGLNGLF